MEDEPKWARDVRDERDALAKRVKRALELLREWRDKYEQWNYVKTANGSSGHQTDLLRETIRILENR